MSTKSSTGRPSNNPKGRPKTSNRDDVSVKVDRALKSKAEGIARHRGVSVAQVITEAAEANIAREYLRVLKELEAIGKL